MWPVPGMEGPYLTRQEQLQTHQKNKEEMVEIFQTCSQENVRTDTEMEKI